MMTRDRLYTYLAIKMETNHLLERLHEKECEELLPGKKENLGVIHQATAQSYMENAAIRKMEYQDEITNEVEKNIAEMHAIESAISAIDDPLERTVLRVRYIDGDGYRHKGWREIATKIYGDDSEKNLKAIHRVHASALLKIQKGR